MEGNIAATYTLIYRFLKQQSQHKAAEAVKKAAKTIVVLREDIEQEGPPLEDIIKEWRTKKNTKAGNAESSSEDLESSDDSSSDSEDDPDSNPEDTSRFESEKNVTDGSDEVPTSKKLPKKAAERDTSVTLSSENAREMARQAAQVPKKQSIKDKSKSFKSDSSDSDSSDSDSPSKRSASDSSSPEPSGSPSSSDSSDEDEINTNEKARPDGTETTKNESSHTSELSSESDDQSDSESQQRKDMHATKKRRTLESGAAVTTAVTTKVQRTAKTSLRKERPPPKVRERFQRVKVENLAQELLLDNGYKARGGMANDYGECAHRDLVATRGAGFRKEKNKKKRGSYRGGEITMESHSIKFDF